MSLTNICGIFNTRYSDPNRKCTMFYEQVKKLYINKCYRLGGLYQTYRLLVNITKSQVADIYWVYSV